MQQLPNNNAVVEDQVPRPIMVVVAVECDECGEDPILGTRFKSLTRRNYDICRRCLEDNHGGVVDGAFRPLAQDTRLTHWEARRMEPRCAQRSIMVHTLKDLALELNGDNNIADVTLYPVGTVCEKEKEMVQKALTEHTGIKAFHVYTRGIQQVDEIVTAVAEGLKQNRSLCSIGFSIGMNAQLPKTATHALQELMETNTTIRFFFVKRKPDSTNVWDDLEDALFDGLLRSSLQTFRFDDTVPVSDRNKKKAWLAMEINPSLRRVIAKFKNEDNQLDILTADKKHNWMKRWTQFGSSDSERLGVLEEVRSSDLDVVPTLYRLVRGHPGSLLEVQSKTA